MAENEGQSGSQEQQPGRRFSEEQYHMLLHCSEQKDITKWNQWRGEHEDEEILLEGAELKHAHLEEADLVGAHLENADLRKANLKNAGLDEAHLENADLRFAHLEDATLLEAHLEHADLRRARIENAYLEDAHLENTKLRAAHLENADLEGACLENANLRRAHLENTALKRGHLENANLTGANLKNANFRGGHLENAKLIMANLEGASFIGANLNGTDFSGVIVDGKTLIWRCKVDRKTNFEGVGLGSARIDPATRQLLEYNIRRMNWEKWYSTENKSLPELCNLVIWLVKRLVRFFWAMSDYGMSTGRIIVCFLGFAFVFATAYRLWPNLVAFNGKADIQDFQNFLHAFYFSVVTMTTLGFGDIAANPESWRGQVLLMVQVILGYVLLGALVTRFAVLFTAGGPARKFTPMSRETKKKLKRLEEEKKTSKNNKS
jgi:uncharacterized protein YjbI with pentapeptide repeats